MKKNLMFVVCTVILTMFFCSMSAIAHTSENEVKVYIDGNRVEFDVLPQIIENRTLVPMRAVFEKMGMNVEWIDATQTAIATNENDKIEISVGSEVFYRNDEKITLDVPAQVINDRTLVPVRAISESLGCEVKWIDDEAKVSIISSPDKIIGTACIQKMRCLIDYQPIDFANIDGFTYLKATDLDKYGFDVTESDGNYYVIRNKNEIPLLVDEYKDKLIKDIYKHKSTTKYCMNITELWSEPDYNKTFDIFATDKKVYFDDTITNCYNLNGDMYVQADELQKYGTVDWQGEQPTIDGIKRNTLVINIVMADPETVHIDRIKREEEYFHAMILNNMIPTEERKYLNYSGWVDISHGEAHEKSRGITSYENGKSSENGQAYYLTYHRDHPPFTLYRGGEYEGGKLKNGVDVSVDEDGLLTVEEIVDFESRIIYPLED